MWLSLYNSKTKISIYVFAILDNQIYSRGNVVNKRKL